MVEQSSTVRNTDMSNLKYRSQELEHTYKLWQGWSMAIASPIFEICQDN